MSTTLCAALLVLPLVQDRAELVERLLGRDVDAARTAAGALAEAGEYEHLARGLRADSPLVRAEVYDALRPAGDEPGIDCGRLLAQVTTAWSLGPCPDPEPASLVAGWARLGERLREMRGGGGPGYDPAIDEAVAGLLAFQRYAARFPRSAVDHLTTRGSTRGLAPRAHPSVWVACGGGLAAAVDAGATEVDELLRELLSAEGAASRSLGLVVVSVRGEVPPALAPLVVECLAFDSVPVQVRAADVLALPAGARERDESELAALESALASPRTAVRVGAALALADAGRPVADDVVASILAAGRERDPGLRTRIHRALPRLAVPARKALPLLAAGLRSEDPTVRRHAARAIAHYPEDAQPLRASLDRIAQDESEPLLVRDAARSALEVIG